MPWPFRNPIGGDGDPPDWTPPSYATPIKSSSSSEEWTPPDYASPIKEEEKKKSVFSKVKDYLTKPSAFDVTKAIPAQAKQFLEEHPTIRNIGKWVTEPYDPNEMKSMLESTAHPQEIGDFLPLLLAGDIPISALRRAKTAIGATTNLPARRPLASKEIPYRTKLPSPELPIRPPRDLSLPPNFGPDAYSPERRVSSKTPNLERRVIEDKAFEKAKEKFNMGKELPTAEFAYDWPEAGGKQYHIKGGPSDKSTVGEAKLRELGIEIPKESKKPNFVNPFEKKTPEEVSNIQRNAPFGEGGIMPSASIPTELKDVEWKPPEYATPIKTEAEKFASKVKIPELVSEGAPPIRQKTGNFWIDSKNRMEDKALSRRADPIRAAADKAKIDKWNETQENIRNAPPMDAPKNKLKEYQDYRKAESAAGRKPLNYNEYTASKTSGWKPPDYAKAIEEIKVPKITKNYLDTPLEKTGEEMPIGELNKLPKIFGELTEKNRPEIDNLKAHISRDGLKNPIIVRVDSRGNPIKIEEGRHRLAATQELGIENIPVRYSTEAGGLSGGTKIRKLAQERASSLDLSPEGITEMHGGLGAIGGGKIPPSSGPHGPVLDKLFKGILDAKERVVQQEGINKIERAKRFAAFSDVKEEGAYGAVKSMSKLKGEFEKVEPGKDMGLTVDETDELFTAVKRANISPGEKARSYTALFKLMNGEVVPQRNELKLLDDVFGNGFADRIIEMHGGIGAVGLKVSKLASTMKSMQNSISLAAPLRHGIGLVSRKEFYPAFRDMFKFFGNKEFYDASMQALEQRPNYLLGRESELFLSKPNSLMKSEEEFLSSYVGSIPIARNVVGASQRAYTGFLNKLRADTFDSMIKQAEGLGYEPSTIVGNSIIPSKETKAITRYINNATGRGDLGSLNKMTNELNLLLWSPRMISSRITMLTNPKIYTDLPKGMRLDALKSLLGIAALGTTIDTLAAYGGAKVSTNILSTDFGKSRFGTKLIDPWGGFQQYIVGAARFLAGKTDSSAPTSRLDIVGRFLSNKLSPAASLAHNILTAKKFTGGGEFTTQYGQKTSIQSEVSKAFTPIFIQDLESLATSEPDWSESIGLSTALGVASLAGMSQDYPEKKKGQMSIRKMRLK